MKVAICERYGPPEVVKIENVPVPTPGDDEVLVQIFASSVNSGDVRLRALRVPRGFSLLVRLMMGFTGLKQPILGFSFAGIVHKVGAKVTKYKTGDRVLASRGFKFGAHADYGLLKETDSIVPLPASVSFEDAAAVVFGGSTAIIFFEQADVKAGETLLINGASGAVGVAAIQIAKQIGLHVTAVCSAANHQLVKSLGADAVIDYAKTDFANNDQTYDLVMDTHGNAPYARIKTILNPGGRFLMVIGDLNQTISALFNKAIINPTKDDIASRLKFYHTLIGWLEQGKILPVIDKSYPLDNIVQAHHYVDSGHKKGNVVITMTHDE